MQNVGYLSSFRPGDVRKPFLIRNGPLLIRAGIVFVGSVVVFLSRKKLSKKFILASLWLLFALFAITLSERPYPHYFIQAVAPISILFATLFTERSVEQSLTVIPLALAFFVPFYYRFWFYSTTAYYSRFINFAFGKDTKSQYFNNFSKNVNRDYKISEFISQVSNKKDRVFMWDNDSATIYALSKHLPPIKYVIDYHIKDYSSLSEEAKKISENPPKFIILTNSDPYPDLNPLIRARYILVNQIDDANIYSRIDFAPGK